jgi:hypothetical protein
MALWGLLQSNLIGTLIRLISVAKLGNGKRRDQSLAARLSFYFYGKFIVILLVYYFTLY